MKVGDLVRVNRAINSHPQPVGLITAVKLELRVQPMFEGDTLVEVQLLGVFPDHAPPRYYFERDLELLNAP